MDSSIKPARTPGARQDTAGWKLLLVDDDQDIHYVTRLVLGDFRFENRPLEIISASSAAEARRVLAADRDIAVVLLDVVMESDRAGLGLVEYIRNELENHDIRIVLRTGQPGQAPEHEVIARYDINDYKEKTELTAQKLSTTVFSALRAWRDIRTIRAGKRGLERVLEASNAIFSQERQLGFRRTIVEQLDRLVATDAVLCLAADDGEGAPLRVVSVIGDTPHPAGDDVRRALPGHLLDAIDSARRSQGHRFGEDHYVLYFRDDHGSGAVLFIGAGLHQPTSELDANLVQLLAANIGTALQNLALARDLSDAQMETIYLLAGATETRSRETAAHVQRVGLLASMLARMYGLDDATCRNIRLAAPLHDIGKIGIPDSVLNKPGGHTPEEAGVMRTHPLIGHRMLASSRRPVLQLAAEIALSHHEHWDGGGYPSGLAGDDIPVSGRITMLADVFDALGSQRCYKDPWPTERIVDYIAGQSGKMFDPTLVRLLLRNLDQAAAIRAELPD